MFNPEDYRSRKKEVMAYFKKKGIDSGTIAEYSCLTGIPLLAVYAFIGEDYPEKLEFCQDRMKEIKEFYGL